MRTLNVRLAAILLTIGIVLSSSFYLVHKYQIRRNAYAFMRQADHWEELAEQATKKNDLKQALRCYMQAGKCLKGYVYLVPNDVDALEKYGMLLADIAQDYRGHLDAYVVLERTLREDPERTRARRRLVGVAVTVGRYQDARQHLKESLLRDYPKDPLLWDLLGQCYMGTNDSSRPGTASRRPSKYHPGKWRPIHVWCGYCICTCRAAQRLVSGWTSWCKGIRRKRWPILSGPSTCPT